jgi:hypothetical protein
LHCWIKQSKPFLNFCQFSSVVETGLLKPLGRTGGRWLDKIKMNITHDGRMYDELFWLRKETSSEHVSEVSFSYKIQGILLSEEQLPSRR